MSNAYEEKGVISAISILATVLVGLAIKVLRAWTLRRNSIAQTDATIADHLRSDLFNRIKTLEHDIVTLRIEQDRERQAKYTMLTNYTLLRTHYQILVLNQHRLVAFIRSKGMTIEQGVILETPSADQIPDLLIKASDAAAGDQIQKPDLIPGN